MKVHISLLGWFSGVSVADILLSEWNLAYEDQHDAACMLAANVNGVLNLKFETWTRFLFCLYEFLEI